MFIAVEFQSSEGKYVEHVNVTHITRLSFRDVKNTDAGTKIHLRTGDILKTSIPMDLMHALIDEAWKEMASVVVLQFVNDKLNLNIEFTEESIPRQDSDNTSPE